MISEATEHHIRRPGSIVSLAAVALVFPIMIFLARGNHHFILYYLASAAAFVLLAFPRLCCYLFLLSVSFYYPYFVGGTAIHPFDICMFLLTASVFLNIFLRGKNENTSTRIDRFFLLLILATVLSTIFAYDMNYSLVPCARIIVIFVAFKILYSFALQLGIRKLAVFYVYHVFALSLMNIVLFLQSGGKERIFGPAWLAFETYSMTALPMAIAIVLWADHRRDRFRFSIIAFVIGLALLATQSRGPLVAVVASIPALLFFAYWKTRTNLHRPAIGVLRKAILPVSIIILVAFLYKETLFEGTLGRLASFLDSLRDPQETVYTRVVIWQTAINAFLTSPLTGIGVGNFKIVGQIVTNAKLENLWGYQPGMSVHNVVLHYLAETGIIGALSFLALAAVNLKLAIQSFSRSTVGSDIQVSALVLVSIFVFCITSFYMRVWTWGQEGFIMALLFALNVAWNTKMRQSSKSAKIQ